MGSKFFNPYGKSFEDKLDLSRDVDLFDNFEIFRLMVCLGCFVSLLIFESYFLSIFVLSICGFLGSFMYFGMRRNILLRRRVECLRLIKRIYDYPVMVEDEGVLTYNFVVPSKDLVNEIAYLDKVLDY